MSGGDHLHPALGDGPRRLGLQLRPDLVHDDNLRRVVLHSLDQHVVLPVRHGHLHPPGPADPGVRNVSVPSDLVAGVHHHHAPAVLLGEDARDLSNRRRLPHARPTQEEHRRARGEQVPDQIRAALDGASHACGEAHDAALAVTNDGDAVQRPVDARAVIAANLPDGVHGSFDVVVVEGKTVAEDLVAVREPRDG